MILDIWETSLIVCANGTKTTCGATNCDPFPASLLSLGLLDMRAISLLRLNFGNSMLQVMRLEVGLLHPRNEQGCVGEQVLHLLERTLSRFREHSPEEEGVGQVANLRKRVSFIAFIVHRDNLR